MSDTNQKSLIFGFTDFSLIEKFCTFYNLMNWDEWHADS